VREVTVTIDLDGRLAVRRLRHVVPAPVQGERGPGKRAGRVCALAKGARDVPSAGWRSLTPASLSWRKFGQNHCAPGETATRVDA
jgi:hypothetical protein